MSYILEALRKSERERQSRQAPGMAAVIADAPTPRRGWLPWVLVGALVVINVVALSVFLLRGNQMAEVAKTPAVAVSPAPVPPVPVAAVPARKEPAAVEVAPVPAAPRKTVKETTKVRPQVHRDADEPRLEPMPDLKPLHKLSPASAKMRAAEPATGETAYKINVLAYPAAETERFAIINMTKYVKGDRLPDGAVVEDIQPDAVVLSRKGERLRNAH